MTSQWRFIHILPNYVVPGVVDSGMRRCVVSWRGPNGNEHYTFKAKGAELKKKITEVVKYNAELIKEAKHARNRATVSKNSTTTMTSNQTTQKTFKVGDRVMHVQDLVTVKSINPDGSVNTDKFFATSLDDLVLYVDPSKANAETKTDGVFQIGDRVRVIENGNVFVISEIQFSHPKTDNWYGRKHIEHYTNEMELAEIDKQIMKLIETKAKLINETKK